VRGVVANAVVGEIDAAVIVGGVFAIDRLASTGGPFSAASLATAVQRTVSARLNDPRKDGPLPDATPLTAHAKETVVGSSSLSNTPTDEQVRVSPKRAVTGEICAAASVGGAFPTVTLWLRDSPTFAPSNAAAVQTTTSPRRKTRASVDPFPAGLPFTVHSKVDWSASPSTSAKPAVLHVIVGAVLVGVAGLSVTPAIVGTALPMTTDALTALPVEKPSLGVATQRTRSPRW
jgi:hypothetical protein